MPFFLFPAGAEEELTSGRRASKLRKKGEAVYDAKYAGKKGSRKDIYEAGSEEEDEEDEEMDGFEDLEGGSDEDEGMEDDGGDSEEGEAEEEEEEEEAAPVKAKKDKKSSSGKSRATTTDQDEKAMLKQLKQAASADVDKGRDVKKQLVRPSFVACSSPALTLSVQALCDNLLEARIKIQKATTSANSLPQVPSALLSASQVRTLICRPTGVHLCRLLLPPPRGARLDTRRSRVPQRGALLPPPRASCPPRSSLLACTC